MQKELTYTKTTKLVLAALLLGCLLPMPYGYFQLVRFLALIGFGYLALDANKHNSETEMYLFIALAAMFQPFIKISFGRFIWNVIDVIVALGLIGSILTKENKS